MKKLNSYLPIWIIIMVPPILFLTLAYNAIIVAVALLCVCYLINRKVIFKNYLNNFFKIFSVAILIDVVTFALMMLPEFFYNNRFIRDNIITPLEHNPYSNIVSFIYVLLILALNIFIAYKFIKKIIINKHNLKKYVKLIIYFILTIALIPYMFFIPSNMILKADYNVLEDYRGTVIQNKVKVSNILKYLDTADYISSYVLDTHKEPFTINIYIKDMDLNYQQLFEKDAAVLLSLIDDVNEVNFYIGEIRYHYTINSINKIFKNVKKLSLTEIYARYEDTKFEEYTYLGNVSGYDVFDTSEFCELEHQVLFDTGTVSYYLSCASLEKIILYNKDTKINIKKALEDNTITIQDLLNSNMDLIMKGDEVSSENTN